MGKRSRVGALVLCGMSVALWGQQAVAPPPRPVDGGPSLEATMGFVQAKLGDLGLSRFTVSVHDEETGRDWTSALAQDVSSVKGDSPHCSLYYHVSTTRDGILTQNGTVTIDWSLAEKIMTLPLEQDLKELDRKAGHSTWISRSDSNLIVLRVRLRNKVDDEFTFTDPEMADRVAKAMTHAIELCGGGNKDPF